MIDINNLINKALKQFKSENKEENGKSNGKSVFIGFLLGFILLGGAFTFFLKNFQTPPIPEPEAGQKISQAIVILNNAEYNGKKGITIYDLDEMNDIELKNRVIELEKERENYLIKVRQLKKDLERVKFMSDVELKHFFDSVQKLDGSFDEIKKIDYGIEERHKVLTQLAENKRKDSIKHEMEMQEAKRKINGLNTALASAKKNAQRNNNTPIIRIDTVNTTDTITKKTLREFNINSIKFMPKYGKNWVGWKHNLYRFRSSKKGPLYLSFIIEPIFENSKSQCHLKVVFDTPLGIFYDDISGHMNQFWHKEYNRVWFERNVKNFKFEEGAYSVEIQYIDSNDHTVSIGASKFIIQKRLKKAIEPQSKGAL